MNSLEKLVRDTFNWSDAEASSNLGVLFPQGLQHADIGQLSAQQQQQQQQQQQFEAQRNSNAAFLAAPQAQAQGPQGAVPAVASPASVSSRPAAGSPFSRADAALLVAPRPPAAAAAAAAPAAVSANASNPPAGAGPHIVSPFAGLAPELLLSTAGTAVPAAAGLSSAAAAASPTIGPGVGAGGGSSGSKRIRSVTTSVADEQHFRTLLQQQLIMQRAQEVLLMAQQQQQQQALQPAAIEQHPLQHLAAAEQQQRKGRRGRPPKADGNYSAAYAALKKYRQRKRSEVDEMEAELAAKQAQLLALQQENQALRSKQEALESTIEIQEKVVAQLSALQVAEQEAAAAAAAAGDASSTPGLIGPGRSANGAPANVSAVIAALTGEPEVPEDDVFGGCQAQPDPNNPGAGVDWAGVTGARAQKPPDLSSVLQAEELNVPALLERYKGYVATAAAALQQLAAALQQKWPAQYPPNVPVPPAVLGSMTPEEAAEQLRVVIPHAPFGLGEYLALGNDERLPPALPAINLLTGKHESIEPQIWRVVASQLTLRPGQAEKLAAAWQLYSASLDRVNEERATLMRRLQDALETCHRSSAAADAAGVRLSDGGVQLGVEPTNPNDAAVMISDEKLLADVLNQYEYNDLSEAIDDNLAREDQIMILFDYALFMMTDELQLAQIVVCSWPFFPHMGAICTWLLDEATVAVAADTSGC